MAVHTIMLPDIPDRRLRSIVWDDEAGTVEGDHHQVPFFRRVLAAPKPVTVGAGHHWYLRDPGHDPAEMLVLIFRVSQTYSHARPPLPPIFDGVELPEGEPGEELYDERGRLLR